MKKLLVLLLTLVSMAAYSQNPIKFRALSSVGGATLDRGGTFEYIVQANGKVEVVKNFLFTKKYPKVLAGAEVFIPVDNTERKSFSFERATSILTTSLTLIFLLRTL